MCFIEGPETHPDILSGGHGNQYQFKNAIKSGGEVFRLKTDPKRILHHY